MALVKGMKAEEVFLYCVALERVVAFELNFRTLGFKKIEKIENSLFSGNLVFSTDFSDFVVSVRERLEDSVFLVVVHLVIKAAQSHFVGGNRGVLIGNLLERLELDSTAVFGRFR
jgi:hypothetical protein